MSREHTLNNNKNEKKYELDEIGRKPWQKKYFTTAWCFYHGLIIAAFVISMLFTKEIKIDADYANMIPSTQQNEAVKIAEKEISKNSSASVFMLASHEDFDKAKTAAETAYAQLSSNDKFSSISLYQDLSSSADILDFLAEYRFQLLPVQIQEQLMAEGGAEEFSQEALSKVFGGFSLIGLDNLESDPFLFDEANLTGTLEAISDAGTSLQPKDGVLATNFEGKWYVMIRGMLTTRGSKLASKDNAIPDIYNACLPLETDGVRFVFYGTTFHSHKSSTSASDEISAISTVSMLVVLIMLLTVFRNGIPLICSVASIVISMLVSFCATHLVFGNLHMATLIFGTSLIGSSIDYSLHYFINWKGNKELSSPQKIRKHIFAGLILSLISTEICYAMLLGAPFTMLKQMALFSFVGILSSFLTATGLFPLFKLPSEEKRRIPLYEKIIARLSGKKEKYKKAALGIQLFIFIATALTLAINHKRVKIQNDVSNFYRMEGRLKDDTILAYKVLNYNPINWLIVSGNSAEEVLQTEESLFEQLPDTFVATSKFIPSVKKQEGSILAAEKLLPFTEEQMSYFGFDETSAVLYQKNFEQLKAKKAFLTPDDKIPESMSSLIKMLWIGEVDGKYYSIILPSHISDEELYIQIAGQYDNVYYVNKAKSVSESMDKLTRLIVIMFALSFAVILVIMKFFYSWKDTFKIASIPVLSVLTILSVFTVAGLKIEFFCITGIILVFGLGLDYVIYRLENKNNSLESFAIALSFVTTVMSFGALALSSFVPVHVLGLSISSGLATAFICAML